MSQMNLFGDSDSEELTCSPPASPVSRTRSPGNRKARTTSATSGPLLSESSAELSRAGACLRTSLVSALQSLTPFCLIWKRQATPSGHWLWVLGRSALHTGETGSGSLPEDWMTPTNQDSKTDGSKSLNAWTDAVDQSKRLATPYQRLRNQAIYPVAEWKTPDVPNGGRSYKEGRISETGMTPDGRKRQVGQANQVRMTDADAWPTPHANCHTGAGTEGRDGGLKVQTAVEQTWPTPAAQDYRDGRSNQHDKNAQPLNEVVALIDGQQNPESDNATGKRQELSEQWRTPNAYDGQQRHNQKGTQSRIDRGKTISLGMQVAHQANNCRLNPAWVAQLMGYPDGWLDIE